MNENSILCTVISLENINVVISLHVLTLYRVNTTQRDFLADEIAFPISQKCWKQGDYVSENNAKHEIDNVDQNSPLILYTSRT